MVLLREDSVMEKPDSLACLHYCCVSQTKPCMPTKGKVYSSLRLQVYSDLGESQVVHSSWAVLALIAAQWHLIDPKAIEAGVKYLIAAQLPSGDWPQEHITGVFNRNCMISYSNYR